MTFGYFWSCFNCFSFAGWSCVTSGTACATFSAFAGKNWRLLVGPWNHGGVQHVRYCSSADAPSIGAAVLVRRVRC